MKASIITGEIKDNQELLELITFSTRLSESEITEEIKIIRNYLVNHFFYKIE